MLRRAFVVTALFAVACSGDTTPNDTQPTPEDTAANPAIDPDILGTWSRTLGDTEDDITVVWTSRADGSCSFSWTEPAPAEVACTYTASDGVFTIQDADCKEGIGEYGYTINGDTNTLSSIEDPCWSREWVLDGDWTRMG